MDLLYFDEFFRRCNILDFIEKHTLLKPDMGIQFFFQTMEGSFWIFSIQKQTFYPSVFFQCAFHQFIARFHNGEKVFFLIAEMGLYFVQVKPCCIFHHSFRRNVLAESFSYFPSKEQSKMVLPAKWLQCFVPFNWFFGFHIFLMNLLYI